MLKQTRCACVASVWILSLVVGGQVHAHPGHASHEPVVDPEVVRLAALVDRLAGADASEDFAAASLALALATGSHADYAAAEEAYLDLVERVPGQAEAWIGVARSRLGTHAFPGALDAARRAVWRTSAGGLASRRARGVFVDAALAQGRYVEALAVATCLVDEDLNHASLGRLGMVLLAMGRLETAEATLREAVLAADLLGSSPNARAWCSLLLGEALVALGRHDEARGPLGVAIEDPRARFEADYLLALIDEAEGNIESAESRLLRLVAQRPMPRYELALVRVLRLHGEPADLREARSLVSRIRSALTSELGKGDAAHRRDLIELMLAEGEDSHAALELARADLESGRDDPRGHELVAVAAARAGRTDEAIRHARIAVLRCGNAPLTLVRCGLAVRRAGEAALGRSWIDRGLSFESALLTPLRASMPRYRD